MIDKRTIVAAELPRLQLLLSFKNNISGLIESLFRWLDSVLFRSVLERSMSLYCLRPRIYSECLSDQS